MWHSEQQVAALGPAIDAAKQALVALKAERLSLEGAAGALSQQLDKNLRKALGAACKQLDDADPQALRCARVARVCACVCGTFVGLCVCLETAPALRVAA